MILRLLLDGSPRPDVNHRYENGQTLLFRLISSYSCRDQLKLLLDAGADPMIPDNSGTIPLQLSTRYKKATAMLLDAAPQSINHVDANGRSIAMSRLAQLGEYPYDGRLGALDTTAVDKNGDTLLHIAMMSGDGKMIKVIPKLLKLPIDVFCIGYQGTTVLMKAFMNGCGGIIQANSAKTDKHINACLKLVIGHILRGPRSRGHARKEPEVEAEVEEETETETDSGDSSDAGAQVVKRRRV
jgi:ankyrin repeat protein